MDLRQGAVLGQRLDDPWLRASQGDVYKRQVYHPHQELHHIKKENIGLIEVMGLAVLPARLKDELAELGEVLAANGNPREHTALEKHADWAEELRTRYTFTANNAGDILQQDVYKRQALLCGAYSCLPFGESASVLSRMAER